MGRKTNKYKKAINDLRKIYQNRKTIVKDIAEHACDYIEYDLNNIFKTAIENYYYDYNPMYYRRKYALYKIYKIHNNQGRISWDFNASNMPDVHRVDNDYIKKWMFEEGYHGGAHYEKKSIFGDTIGDEMKWFSPHPIAISRLGLNVKPFSKPSKYSVYKSRYSPADEINEALIDYEEDGDLQNRINQAIKTVFWRYDVLA